MFERFTEAARRSLFFARYETTIVGGVAIEAEHLLLGLLRADSRWVPNVFVNASLSYADAREKIRTHLGNREPVSPSVEIPFSAPAKRIMQYAADEAQRLGHRHIGNEHLLLSVLREESSFAAGMLKSHGAIIEQLREQIAKSSVVPDSAFQANPPSGGRLVSGESFDPAVSVERIRFLTEQLGQRDTHVDNVRGLMDEIHHHLDALKRHLGCQLSE